MLPDLVKSLWVCFWGLLFLPTLVQAASMMNWDAAYVSQIEKKYGLDAKKRLLGWEAFIKKTQSESKTEKEVLSLVNNFFNIYQFIPDSVHWKQEDYWATPLEFLVSGGGDCEDFVIIKYFTLIALQVPEQKLLFTYVKALNLNQAHMVLSYYETPQSMPLVLDNLIGEIKPASEREDLVPVYSFNGIGVWLPSGKNVGKSTNMNSWSDMIRRMDTRRIAQFNQ